MTTIRESACGLKLELATSNLEKADKLIVVTTVTGDGFEVVQQWAFLGKKLDVPTLGANHHGMRAANPVGEEGKAGRPVIREFGIATQTGNGQLVSDRPNAGVGLIVMGWLNFHDTSLVNADWLVEQADP